FGKRAWWVEPQGQLPSEGLLVLVLGDVVFDVALIERLLASARDGAPAFERAGSGLVLAADATVVKVILRARDKGTLDETLAAFKGEPGAGLILPASTPAERRAATKALLKATGKPVDGPLTRLFERRIS